jgi:hypothetical protein
MWWELYDLRVLTTPDPMSQRTNKGNHVKSPSDIISAIPVISYDNPCRNLQQIHPEYAFEASPIWFTSESPNQELLYALRVKIHNLQSGVCFTSESFNMLTFSECS